jgi:hypothetical protein
MGSMQSWLPAQGEGTGVLRALPVVMAVVLQAQLVLGFDGALTVLPHEPVSTLGAHVPPQNLELQKTVLDFVDGEILGELPAARTSRSAATSRQAASPSPFRKWVKPQTGGAVATDAPEPVTLPSEKPILEVARRLRISSPRRSAPTTSSRSSAIASDRGKHQDLVVPTPERSSYPEPEVDEELSTPTSGDSATEELTPLTPTQLRLRKKVRSVLNHYHSRPMNTRDRSPWELMHAMLAFEAHSQVLQGGPDGKPITAVGWLCYNQACKRRTLMYVNDENELQVRVGPALQGHRGQLLAMLAQSRINENYPLLVEGHELKVADLVEMEKRTCYPRTELTFKLIGLMHYLDSDASWVNDQGMQWDIPRLIAEEIRQPVRGAACGGTHRLSGLTLAYKTREKRGEPVEGQYLQAKKFVTRYQQYAYRLQNRDGSFSTEWFRGPGNEQSIDRKLKTTGHLLEWLLYAANEKELHHGRTTKAVNYLASIMQQNSSKDWEAGPLGHALHALLVYDRMVFSPHDAQGESTLATKTPTSRQTARKR